MGRKGLLAELAAYGPYDETEADALRRIAAFISDHGNCFDRSLRIGHMTAGAWLLDESGERVLLTHHKKLNRWLQLGGHADGCSDLRAVALSEAREESGIASIDFVSEAIFDLDVHLIPAYVREPSHYHYDVRFLMRVVGDSSFQVSGESHDLGWFTHQELASLDIDASARRLAAKWQSWLRFGTHPESTAAPL